MELQEYEWDNSEHETKELFTGNNYILSGKMSFKMNMGNCLYNSDREIERHCIGINKDRLIDLMHFFHHYQKVLHLL